MDDLIPKDIFLRSLERCARSRKFMPAFYNRFLSTSDVIRDKFKNTNFENQHRMLIRSLRLAAHAAAGQPDALQEIRERALTHDRYHLHIEPNLYDHWRSALIETSREFDDKWDDDVEKAWYTILGHVINHMIKYY
jgi:hemoglobin-like flavoprotein